MVQQFHDAIFNGSVRIKGRLQLDHPLPSKEQRVDTSVIDARLQEIEERLHTTADSGFTEELESQKAALNVLQREVGALVASMHTTRDGDGSSPTLMSAIKAQQAEFVQQQQLMREQQRELASQHEQIKQQRLEQDPQPSYATSDSVRQMQGELQALRQQLTRVEPAGVHLEKELSRMRESIDALQSSKPRLHADARMTAHTIDTMELMIQTYISDLRNEFVHAQRDPVDVDVRAALEKFEVVMGEREAALSDTVRVMNEAIAAAVEKTEATRRQLATLVAEVDSIRQVVRQTSTL